MNHILEEQTRMAHLTRGGSCKFLQLRHRATVNVADHHHRVAEKGAAALAPTGLSSQNFRDPQSAGSLRSSLNHPQTDNTFAPGRGPHAAAVSVNPLTAAGTTSRIAGTASLRDSRSSAVSSSMDSAGSSSWVPAPTRREPPKASGTNGHQRQQHQHQHQQQQQQSKESSCRPREPSAAPTLDIDSMPLPMPGQRRQPDYTRASEMAVQADNGQVVLVSSNAPSPTSAEHLVPCTICGRNFAASRLQKHQTACETASRKRRQFDMKDKRLDHLSPEEVRDAERRAAAAEAMLKRKPKSTWRQQRAQLLAGIAPNAAKDDVEELIDERKECAGCGRRFAHDAWERHQPKCVDKMRRHR